MADEIVFDKSDSNKNAENAGDLLVKKCVNEKNESIVGCLFGNALLSTSEDQTSS